MGLYLTLCNEIAAAMPDERSRGAVLRLGVELERQSTSETRRVTVGANGGFTAVSGGSMGDSSSGATNPGSGAVWPFAEALAADGENVEVGSVIAVPNGDGVAYLARADRGVEYRAIGVVKSAANVQGLGLRVKYETGGKLHALKTGAFVTGRHVYLSAVTPGRLTDDPNESPESKRFLQDLGLWTKAVGSGDLVEVFFSYSPPFNTLITE